MNDKITVSKNMSGLVSLLNGFQVVRMMELLGLLGSLDYIREQGGLGSCGCRVVICKLRVYLVLGKITLSQLHSYVLSNRETR